MKRVKMFCLPYAGGSAIYYSRWSEYFPKAIEVIPVELAGRGRRLDHPFYQDLSAALEDVYGFIKDSIVDNDPYILFGHSMGAILSYELCKQIKALNVHKPLHLFVSGLEAPKAILNEKIYHNMSDEQLKKEMIDMGGTPPEFFDYKELEQIFLEILRNDFRIVETYKCQCDIKIDTDITVFYGSDEMDREDVIGWMNHTEKKCNIYEFKGRHFFINNYLKQIIEIICDAIK